MKIMAVNREQKDNKAHGFNIRCLVKEYTHGLIEDDMKVITDHCSNTKMMKDMAMMKCIGQKAGDEESSSTTAQQRAAHVVTKEKQISGDTGRLIHADGEYMKENGQEIFIKSTNPLDPKTIYKPSTHQQNLKRLFIIQNCSFQFHFSYFFFYFYNNSKSEIQY